jgi:hypothetical protein
LVLGGGWCGVVGVGGGLEREQLGIHAGVRDELVVAAVLDDPPAVENKDVVGIADGVVPMRDQQHGPAAVQLPDAGEQVMLSPRVQRRGGLVQDDQRSVADERPGQRDPLPLAHGQVGPIVEEVADDVNRVSRRVRRTAQLGARAACQAPAGTAMSSRADRRRSASGLIQ